MKDKSMNMMGRREDDLDEDCEDDLDKNFKIKMIVEVFGSNNVEAGSRELSCEL